MKDQIKVEYVLATELKAADYNPRTHSTEDAERLKESIKRFGMIDPLICNKATGRMNVVIGGHFRLEMAKELDIKTVP